jgi:hypothetical protein
VKRKRCSSEHRSYSLQGCDLSPPSVLSGLSLSDLPLWSPLSPAPVPRDAAARPRTGRGGRVRLSLEHNDSNSSIPSISRPKPAPVARVWSGASLGFIPGTQEFDRHPRPLPLPPRGLRGVVRSLSEQSRRHLQRFLDTIDASAVAYSMCLTCPGKWNPEWNCVAKESFLRLLKQMTSSRDPLIRHLGTVWKQELQKREAVHFHLLFWGVPEDQIAHVQSWIATRWSALVCSRMHPADKAKHLAWHLHPRNFFKVRNMSRYYAKYLGKDEEAALLRCPIPGRWWGKVNSDCIPFVPSSDQPLGPAASIIAKRIGRKLQQKRANEARHYSICKGLGLVENGKPVISQFGVYVRKVRGKVGIHEDALAVTGKRFGPCRLPLHLKTASVYFSGPSSPATVQRIIDYALECEFDIFSDIPF